MMTTWDAFLSRLEDWSTPFAQTNQPKSIYHHSYNFVCLADSSEEEFLIHFTICYSTHF